MKALMKTISGGLAAATLALAVPAAAQMELYEDYVPADEVVELTFVKVDEGQLETYLEGLKSTWVAANELQKKLGYVSSYAIYAVPYGDNEFNMVLRVSFPNTEMLGPNKARYMKFLDEYGKTKIDQSNKTVLELYNRIRKIQGTYILREMKLTK
ncbi:hypothetical protein OIK40_06920 [Erythrobacter sp. sf7]|uniref:Uncharacterized protein n=1 Tax=Erythrobacter fulvus TaxID=2987523 RepID=A0ABT5JNY9_9SPHN|nr:hypothetical protein [Erythrobacter fulvus]MDC8754374.1 hypothetical protein [Erythrobacter fulvus]